MWKIAVCLLVAGLAALPVGAQQGPTANLKALGASLDSLGRDTTLTDTGRLSIQHLAKTYKGLVQKLKDSIDLARKAHKADTVVIKIADTPVKRGADVIRKDLPVKPVVLLSLDSARALIAADRKEEGNAVGLFPYIALLLVGIGGVGWGLFLYGRRKAVKPLVEVKEDVKPLAGVRPLEEVKPLEPVKEVVADGSGVMEKASFVCELMMTAGPRKKFMNEENADKDLGEDVCGCVVRGDTVGVWLLDGTSDQFCLRYPVTGKEYFSSRLLAQDIGDRLREAFEAPGKDGYVLDRIMTEAIDAVQSDWVKALRGLPEDERAVLVDNIRVNNCPECSSTMLSAVLSLDGKASAYRSGDSKLLVFERGEDPGGGDPKGGDPNRVDPAGGGSGGTLSAASFTTKNPGSNDRIFFRIVLDKADQLDILSNKPACEVVQLERVSALIAFSDGIGSVTETTLKTEYAGNPTAARRRIGHQMQGTADDKSICIVSISEE